MREYRLRSMLGISDSHVVSRKSNLRHPWLLVLLATAVVALLVSGCVGGASVATESMETDDGDAVVETATPEAEAETPVEAETIALAHIHGMGFSVDGETLSVGTHEGLRIFEENQWFESKGPRHDYINLSATADGFYASGRPAPNAPEGSPLGLVRSIDKGESLQMLAFEGESEFHVMGAGYHTNAIYLVNDAENSELPLGLHYTLDDGASWQTSAAQGVTSVTLQLAVHPTDSSIIAFGTEGGVILSTDHGNSFALVTDATPQPAVTFDPTEEGVLYYGFRNLMRLAPDGGDSVALKMPDLGAQDALISIAFNPLNSDELAIATFDSFVWRTLDGGENWQLIADPAAE